MSSVKTTIFFLSMLVPFIVVVARVPDTLWTRTYGNWNSEELHDIFQTPDSGYIFVGITNSMGAGGWDTYLLRTYPDGDTVWTKTYGGAYTDAAHAMCLAPDGGYILVGTRQMGDFDLLIMKTDTLGDSLWAQAIGGMMNDWLDGVCPSPNSGYVGTGAINVNNYSTSGNLVVMRFKENGDTTWVRSYGGSSYDSGSSIDTTENGYIICGFTNSYGAGGSDIWLVRTDTAGVSQWTRTYGGPDDEYGSSVSSTDDGGYIIAGYTASYGAGNWDAYLIKTDSNGDSVWTRTYGGSLYDAALHVFQAGDNNYVVTGFSGGTGEWQGGDVWIMKIDENGDTLWTGTYGGVHEEWGFAAKQTMDGGYIIGAKTWSFGAGECDIYLIKLAPETGITEHECIVTEGYYYQTTIVRGPLLLPADTKFKIFDITGCSITTNDPAPGIYFIESDASMIRKVIKID
jgi:hypothetical protein